MKLILQKMVMLSFSKHLYCFDEANNEAVEML